MSRLVSRVVLLASLLALACSRPEAPPDRLPSNDSGREQIEYALKLLRRGDDSGARVHLERASELGAGRGTPQDSSMFLRDLAEVRLATGDGAGAAQAAETGLERLARVPTTAQFVASERNLFERLLTSLVAAGRGDLGRLADLAAADPQPPTADPWYLLGWVHEQQSDAPQARQAYRRYLAASPEFDLLRRSTLMRQHAQQVVDRA